MSQHLQAIFNDINDDVRQLNNLKLEKVNNKGGVNDTNIILTAEDIPYSEEYNTKQALDYTVRNIKKIHKLLDLLNGEVD